MRPMAPLGSTVATQAGTYSALCRHAHVDYVEVTVTPRAGVAVQDVYAAEVWWEPASLILLNVLDPTLDEAQRTLGHLVPFGGAQPNGSRLSCGRPARRRKRSGRTSRARQGTTQRLSVRTRAPASFKRLLGGWPFSAPVAFSSVGPSSAPPSVDSSASAARAAAGIHQVSRHPARSPA